MCKSISKTEVKLRLDSSQLEELKKLNPEFEIWWDGHPGHFRKFLAELLEKGYPREEVEKIRKWMSHIECGTFFFDGCTTNPPLNLQFLQNSPEVVSAIKEKYANLLKRSWWYGYWITGKLGMDKFLSNYYRRGRKYGFVCMQVDPHYPHDTEIMKLQAMELARAAPNAMIKIPATKAGIEVIRYLTSLGISTNATSCFCVPQVAMVAQAVKEGYEEGVQKGVDYSGWRSVITMMIGRWEASTEWDAEANEMGETITEEDRRYFGLLMVRKAVEVVKSMNAPTKVLVCSTRKGPGERYLHMEGLAGLPIIVTMNKEAIEWALTLPLRDESGNIKMMKELPQDKVNRLMKFKWVRKSIDPEGLTMDEIHHSSAQKKNLTEFAKALEEIQKIFTI
ncbi:MAG: transaldolase family protein [Nitrososphaerota archaeon]